MAVPIQLAAWWPEPQARSSYLVVILVAGLLMAPLPASVWSGRVESQE